MLEAVVEVVCRLWVVLMLVVAMAGMTWLLVDIAYVLWITRDRRR